MLFSSRSLCTPPPVTTPTPPASSPPPVSIPPPRARLRRWLLLRRQLQLLPLLPHRPLPEHAAGCSSYLTGGTDLEGNRRLTPAYHQNGTGSSGGDMGHYTEPETWRSWSSRRAGSQHAEFQAAEISISKTSVDTDKGSYRDGITKEYGEVSEGCKEIDYHDIRTRLRCLESELTTVLQSVRSKKEDSISKEATGSSNELESLSDALELQENKVMNAKDGLRSIRAKLAVLEGKMTLAIIDAQKIVEVKQKRIDGVRKSLQLLRSTCILYHTSATEVLLTGSFDGWTTQGFSVAGCHV